jgi:hypothetical protein
VVVDVSVDVSGDGDVLDAVVDPSIPDPSIRR